MIPIVSVRDQLVCACDTSAWMTTVGEGHFADIPFTADTSNARGVVLPELIIDVIELRH